MPSKEQIEKAARAIAEISQPIADVHTMDKIVDATWRLYEDVATAALSAAEGVKVRVKPLEWRDAPDGVYLSKTILADSLTGQYSVTVSTGAAYFDGELCGLEGRESCQRVHDAAIRSALQEGA